MPSTIRHTPAPMAREATAAPTDGNPETFSLVSQLAPVVLATTGLVLVAMSHVIPSFYQSMMRQPATSPFRPSPVGGYGTNPVPALAKIRK
jgi:hypothetical protein